MKATSSWACLRERSKRLAKIGRVGEGALLHAAVEPGVAFVGKFPGHDASPRRYGYVCVPPAWPFVNGKQTRQAACRACMNARHGKPERQATAFFSPWPWPWSWKRTPWPWKRTPSAWERRRRRPPGAAPPPGRSGPSGPPGGPPDRFY